MSIMIAQILKFVDFTKTQKFRYLKNKTFFLQIKKFTQIHQFMQLQLPIKSYFMSKNTYVTVVTFNALALLSLTRVQIKHITIAKCALFFHYCYAKEILLYFFVIQNFVQNTQNTKKHINSIYIVGIMFVKYINGFYMTVSITNLGFLVSTQIIVQNHCITKCKQSTACGRLLLALQAIFLEFKIFTLI